MPAASDTRVCYNLLQCKVSWSELPLMVAELKEDDLCFSKADSAPDSSPNGRQQAVVNNNFLNAPVDSASQYLATASFVLV